MNLSVVKIKFSSDKNCFVALSSSCLAAKSQNDLQVFQIETDNQNKAYVSWSGEEVGSSDGADGILKINGLFGTKLGLKDGDDVIIRAVAAIKSCTRVNVEPVSVDDWEIIERHTAFIENRLLDQIRVVWPGQVFPVWVEKSICVFLKVGDAEPDADCVILCNETEVILAPKLRNQSKLVPVEEPIKQSVSNTHEIPYLPSADSVSIDDEPRFTSTDSDLSFKTFSGSIGSIKDFNRLGGNGVDGTEDRRKREKSPYNPSNIASQWQGLLKYFGFKTLLHNKSLDSEESEDELDEDDSIDQSDVVLPNGCNMVLRTQPLRYTVTDKDLDSSPTLVCSSRSGSNSPRKKSSKSGSASPRKGSKEAATSLESKSNFQLNFVPQQTTTVYMDRSDIENQLKCNRQDIPCVFIAKLQKLLSPKEQKQEKLHLSSGNGKSSPRKASGNKTDKERDRGSVDSLDTPETPSQAEADTIAAKGLSSVVRVIVIDKRRQYCNELYNPVVGRLLEEQPCLSGHVIIPDMLRRHLKLDVGSRVWLQTLKGGLTGANAFSLYLLGNKPSDMTNDKIALAFRRWLDQVSSEDYPMLVCQGTFMKFPVLPDKYVECQVTYSEIDVFHKGSYTMLHPGVLRSATLNVISGSRMNELTHPAIQPMLAYTSIASIDPQPQDIDMKNLGGMKEFLELAISNIEICLGSRSLYQNMFLTTPGLMNGMLLLTGAKGSGKSSVVRALCRHIAELPNLGHTLVLDCKPLRGKKVDTIQKLFELIFDEAAWRQPSLIILDDLDHIAASPAGPEFEMSGEALYSARVAEVIKDLLRKDIRNMSHIAVLATCQSRSSLHPILVSSRGTHLVQEVMNINAPNKEQRKEILMKIINSKVYISDSAMVNLDLDSIALKTEGFVARDLVNIVNRAIHACILVNGPGTNSDAVLDITQDNFESALCGFTPASIRNVPLHEAGELGWDDIGGLTDVKNTLIETLQWPTKYPALFANCPLRLRSGLLLYGAPGTGKTLLAGVVAKECGLNFISIKGPELLSKYIGASEQAVRDTFNRAQSAKPCILFFDEFDSMAPRRGHDNTGVTDRVVNQLLTQLDGVEGLDGVYVLAASSRPDLIDPALLRPGRLDKCLHCQMPNEEERYKILDALSKKMSIAKDVDLEYFAKHCEDFTGADYKALLYNAQLEAIHEFTSDETDEGTGKFGMKSKKGPHSKLKSRGNGAKLKLKTDTRRKSFSSGTIAYIPNLTEGIKQVNPEMEERLCTQVSQITLRERRNSEHITNDKPDSPLALQKMLQVNQRHLLTAVSKMRPSVSTEERLKYKRIYENFISAREGNFSMAHLESLGMKATLA